MRTARRLNLRQHLGGYRWLLLFLIIGLSLALFATAVSGQPGRIELVATFALFLGVLGLPLWSGRGPRWYEPVVAFMATRLVMELPKLPYYSGNVTAGNLASWTVLGSLSERQLYSSGVIYLMLSAVGVLAYYFGYYLVPKLHAPAIQFGQPRRRRLVVVLGAVFVGSLLAGAAFVEWRGGLVRHFARWSLEGGGRGALSGQVYFVLLGSLHSLAVLTWLAYVPRASRNVLFWVAAALSGITLFIVNSGNRSVVVFFLLTLLLIHLYHSGRLRFVSIMLLLGGLVVTFSVLGTARRTIPGLDRVSTADLPGLAGNSWAPVQALETIASYQLQLRPNVVVSTVPRKHPFLLGESYLSILVNPIPRRMWSNKPEFVDAKAGATFWGVDWGTPVGAVAEAYWNFSVGGVLLMFGLFGMFHRWLWSWATAAGQQPAIIVVYFITLVYLWEPYSADVIKWLRMLVPLLFLIILIRRPLLMRRS